MSYLDIRHTCFYPYRWPGIWLNASTDYVCTGNFLLKRHPFTIPFLDLWINSGDVVPELKPFHTWFSWEQRPLNALVRAQTGDGTEAVSSSPTTHAYH